MLFTQRFSLWEKYRNVGATRVQTDQKSEGTRAAERISKLVHTRCSEMGDNEVNKYEQKQDNTSPSAANKKGKRTIIKPQIQEAARREMPRWSRCK